MGGGFKMCGRYQFFERNDDVEEVIRILEKLNDLSTDANSHKSIEIFPTDSAPVLVGNKNRVKIMKWGFPKWGGKGVIINSKSETAAEKKMFSLPLIRQRCVIPSTGFFEWQKKMDSKAKSKYLFNIPDSPILYMAGIYQIFQGTEYFVILTREANRYISDIHDRMPVIMNKDEINGWLYDNNFTNTLFLKSDVALTRKLI